MARRRIGEILVADGVLDDGRLRLALAEQQRWGGPLGRILVDLRLIDEATLVEALSRQLQIPAVDLDAIEVPPAVVELVPGELCEQYSVVPFRAAAKFLDLAMADPTNLGIADELQIRTRLNVRPHLAGPRVIERAIARLYGRGFSSGLRRGGTTGAPPIRGHSIDLAPETRGDGPMEIVRAPDAHAAPAAGAAHGRDAEIAALQQRVSRLEALVARDENVLRKVLSLLVEKGVATREEILERLK